MDESMATAPDNTPKAVKDRKCKFCGQMFTSSSLGRHLDLWIKENNPRPPDGIHDVEEIRKERGAITRRRPKSTGGRNTSVSIGTPTAPSIVSEDAERSASSSPTFQQKDKKDLTAEIASKYPFKTNWQITGVMNDLGPAAAGSKEGRSRGTERDTQRANAQKHLKQQLNAKQEVKDLKDTANAAKLALREIISSLRAAKYVGTSDTTLTVLSRRVC